MVEKAASSLAAVAAIDKLTEVMGSGVLLAAKVPSV